MIGSAEKSRLTLANAVSDRLGATCVDGGVNFAVVSAHAERVELCVFDAAGKRELGRADLPERSGEVWRGFAPKLKPGAVYGYRVYGPWSPEQGHRFNPHKLSLDPYALALGGAFRHGPEHFAYVLESGRPDDTFDTRDNAASAFKGVVVDPQRFKPMRPGPRTPFERSILYETHAKGFTVRLSEVSETERGRISGLATKPALDYIKSLGVTAIELLPIHAFLQDDRLVSQGLRNYWGYNTLNYFCAHPEYAGADPIAEMRGFVDAAHDAGLEVILDVVYNHTCEGDHRGPSLSFRGLDNALYYRLDPNNPARYADVSGCGSTLEASRPAVRRLILDSLSHWVSGYGVDGFRFDIAPTLGQEADGRFHADALFFAALKARPELAGAKLIAEAWDAAGGFHVGHFPHGWAEWNARARDAIRRFWRGDEALAGDFAERLVGSPDVYARANRPAWSSVNFVACHDGFTLADLTRYARKHNLANLEDNRDGPNENFSCNYGVEGPSEDPGLEALRDRQARNLLASALLMFGTPMLLAGDEFLRSQGGNNNAYNQDNAISWIDWDQARTARGAQHVRFLRRVIALRQSSPIWSSDRRPLRHAAPHAPRATWFAPRGQTMAPGDWALAHARCFGALFEPAEETQGEALLILFNAADHGVRFRLPPTAGSRWTSVLDTAAPDRPKGELVAAPGEVFDLPDRSLFIFASHAQQGPVSHA